MSGHLANGDGYTHRYNMITICFKDIKRVTLLWATNSELAEYLTLVGKNGIILNSDKFHFGEGTVDWAGIRLTRD